MKNEKYINKINLEKEIIKVFYKNEMNKEYEMTKENYEELLKEYYEQIKNEKLNLEKDINDINELQLMNQVFLLFVSIMILINKVLPIDLIPILNYFNGLTFLCCAFPLKISLNKEMETKSNRYSLLKENLYKKIDFFEENEKELEMVIDDVNESDHVKEYKKCINLYSCNVLEKMEEVKEKGLSDKEKLDIRIVDELSLEELWKYKRALEHAQILMDSENNNDKIRKRK